VALGAEVERRGNGKCSPNFLSFCMAHVEFHQRFLSVRSCFQSACQNAYHIYLSKRLHFSCTWLEGVCFRVVIALVLRL